jgi:adenylate kinase
MNNLIYLTGAPAAGKSSLSAQVQKDKEGKVVVFEYGKELTKYLQEKGTDLSDQSELRQKSSTIVTKEDISILDNRLLDFAHRNRYDKHVIVDSHAVTKEAFGYRILPFSIEQMKRLNPSKIVVMYAKSETILERISKDTQGRPTISAFESDMHTFLQAMVAVNYGIVLHAPIYYLDSDRPFDEIKASFLKLVE